MTFCCNKKNNYFKTPISFFLTFIYFFAMSAFGFITNSKLKSNAGNSPLLSPSLVEDLYDSQQLNTFINQSRTFTSTPSPPPSKKKNKKPLQQSYFSFIDDLDSLQKPPTLSESSVLPAESLGKSAFGFIDQCKFYFLHFLHELLK